jgi:cullin-associated NEDD8-dissociated protein 1
MQKAALRTAVPVYRLSSQAQAPDFHAFVARQLGLEKWKEFRNYKVQV